MPDLVIAQFTLRQIRKGVVIFGILAALLLLMQGIGFQDAIPSQIERNHIITSFEGNPVFKFLYGENDHAETPAGYMMYRSGPVLGLLGGLWALMFTTKLLRGQEEDGRTELLLAGQTTLGRATAQTIGGVIAGLTISFVIMWTLLAGLTNRSGLGVPVANAGWIAAGFIGVAAFFAMLAAVTSQLAYTRRKALIYGVAPLVLLFVMRSVGNAAGNLYWLKNLTPFGWIDHLHPTFTADPGWLIPLYGGAALFAVIAVLIASRRDFGSALIHESESAEPRYQTVENTLRLGFRLMKGSLIGWAIGCIAISAVVASVAKSAADALSGASGITRVLEQLTSNGPDLILVFMSVGSMFVSILLLAMIVSGISTLREEEGRGIADNLLVRTISPFRYMSERALILIGSSAVIIILSSITTWVVARLQNISISFWSLALDNMNILGPIIFFIGLGLALLGTIPRLTSVCMYVVLIWAFVSQLVASLVKNQTLLDIINNSSLLHHITLAPLTAPNWTSTTISVLLGLTLGGFGLYMFNRRDIETE